MTQLNTTVSTTAYSRRKKMDVPTLAMTALTAALVAIFVFTPLGMISIGPLSITLAGLPVIIGAALLGFGPGLCLGFIWGLMMFLSMFIWPDAMLTPLLFSPAHWYDPALFLVLMLVPRMMVSVVAFGLSRLPLKDPVRYGLASVLGSFTNTVLFLGLLYVLFVSTLVETMGMSATALAAMLFGVATTNGIIEAVSAVVCVPIIMGVKRAVRDLPASKADSRRAAKKAAR